MRNVYRINIKLGLFQHGRSGSFVRGSGLDYKNGRYVAPYTAIYSFQSTLNIARPVRTMSLKPHNAVTARICIQSACDEYLYVVFVLLYLFRVMFYICSSYIVYLFELCFCSSYIFYLFELYCIFVRVMFYICSSYVFYLFELYCIFVRVMFYICSSYVFYLFELCSIFVRVTFSICSSYIVF